MGDGGTGLYSRNVLFCASDANLDAGRLKRSIDKEYRWRFLGKFSDRHEKNPKNECAESSCTIRSERRHEFGGANVGHVKLKARLLTSINHKLRE